MPEPTYRIAQALHARRAAVGLKKYGQHLSADSPGCMLVHALEESADKTNYLIAEVQRRKHLIETLCRLADEMWNSRPVWGREIKALADSLGGEAALAKYDEILGGAKNATVAPDPAGIDAHADPRKIIAEAIADLSATDLRDEALRVAEEALLLARGMFHTYATHHRLKGDVGKYEKNTDLGNQMDAALAAIRGAR